MIKKSKTKFVHLGDRYVPRYYANTNVLNTGIYLDKQTKSPHLILTLPAEYITPKTKFYDVKFINTPQSKVQVLSPITAKNYDDEFILAKYKFDPNPWDKDMFIYGKENTIIENLATKKYKDKTFLMEFNSIELPQKCHKMTYSKKMSNDETYTTKLNLIKIGEQFLRCDEIKKSIKILNELDKLNITNVKIHQSSDDISRTQIYLDGNSRFRATIGSIDEEFIVSK